MNHYKENCNHPYFFYDPELNNTVKKVSNMFFISFFNKTRINIYSYPPILRVGSPRSTQCSSVSASNEESPPANPLQFIGNVSK